MHELKISNQMPPVYSRLRDKFGIDWDAGIIIAYDGIVHCKNNISAQKIVHEFIHFDQQKKLGVELWWDMFIQNDAFRLSQELEAYLAEYAFLKRNIKNREALYFMRTKLAEALSSETYGSIITRKEAMSLIK